MATNKYQFEDLGMTVFGRDTVDFCEDDSKGGPCPWVSAFTMFGAAKINQAPEQSRAAWLLQRAAVSLKRE